MEVVALVSSGKDSCDAIMRCLDYGHKVVALANLIPLNDAVDELDSYMYQTIWMLPPLPQQQQQQQKVERLKALCLQYATSIQLLIPSIDVANPENTSKSGMSMSRIKRSQYREQQLKLASENVVMS